MTVNVLFAGVPVTRLVDALPWYESLFGRAPDIVPHDTEVMWNVVGDGWLYVVEDAPRAGHSLVALAVADLDDALADVRERGLVPDSVEDVGDAARKATLLDPDGNSVSFLEVKDA